MKTEGQQWKVEEKCRAVLAIWTERMKAVEVRQEMGISGSLLIQWQERAMEGMLEALEPRRAREVPARPAIGNTVKKLLDRKARLRENGPMLKLERKMQKLEEAPA